MFVNPERAQECLDTLGVILKELSNRPKLSDLDEKVKSSINDAIVLLLDEPFKPYFDISGACRNYVELRDRLSIERKAWETHESVMKGEMEKISMWLRDKGDELGVDSFNSPYGTAYRNVKVSYRVESWEIYSSWLLKTGNLQCVEKRPAKLAVKEIYEETGELPPGLTEFVEVEFNIRRPTKSKS